MTTLQTHPDEISTACCRVLEETCLPPAASLVREKHYTTAGIGFVTSGYFDYRTEQGSAVAVPGTLLFGNSNEWFSCGHHDRTGNKRLVVYFDEDYLETVANECDLAVAHFDRPALAPGRAAMKIFAQMRQLATCGSDADDLAYMLAVAALTAAPANDVCSRALTDGRQNVLSVVRYIEEHFANPCSLEFLARQAGYSRYHFVRVFKALTGQTPTQYVLHTRLRAAAERLLATKVPVSRVALDVGFNDISHFNVSFRAMFHCAPTEWRKR